MTSIKMILPPQPHYLSGYTGFVPGYKFHYGQTYGKLTHDLFLNRQDEHIKVLADLTKVYSVGMSQEEKLALENRCYDRECKYTTDMKSGYAGHIPQYQFLCGNVFTEEAATALFKTEDIKRSSMCSDCIGSQYVNKNKSDKIKDINEYVHPFHKVSGGRGAFKEKYKKYLPTTSSGSPYFMDIENPQKKFKIGYAGHVPNLTIQNGIPYTPATNEGLKQFTVRNVRNKTNEWLPITITDSEESSEPKSTSQKLPYEDGIIKNYGGHIPGNKFNVGQTFSNGSKNTRLILGHTIVN